MITHLIFSFFHGVNSRRGAKQRIIFYHRLQKKIGMLQALPTNFRKVKPQHHAKMSLVKNLGQRNSSILPYRLSSAKTLQKQDREIEHRTLKINKTPLAQDIQGGNTQKRAERQASSEKMNLHIITKTRNKILNRLKPYLLHGQTDATNYQYLMDLFSGVDYSVNRLKQPSVKFINNKSRLLAESSHNYQKCLFLDLDETLIWTDKEKGELTNKQVSLRISIRPYASSFLEALSQYYEIYVFTSGSDAYAQAAVKRLNKCHPYITDYLCRDSCLQTKKGFYIKDLRIIKNRQLKDIVIVDNCVQSYGFQLSNGIPILPYQGQQSDVELLNLIPFLVELARQDDVRPMIRQRYQLHSLLDISREDIQYCFKTKQK